MAEDIRMARLNQELKKSALKPKALTDKAEWERKQEGFETDEEDEGDEEKKQEENVEGGKSTLNSLSIAMYRVLIDELREFTEMQAEGEESESKESQAKVSTSGPRVSRRESYRSSKGFKVKQTPTTLFTARGESESHSNPLPSFS